ncbi:MAG: UDP-N-acetylglucosamine pyrophosphorylase [Clostridia bacterium]|nr:UDP-N-acetylglucosamine pyrophosphorylase [Clostridia bacterium]
MTDKIKISDLYDCYPPYLSELFDSHEYPWELLPLIKEHISELIRDGIEGFTLYSDNVLIGQNVTIHPTAEINGPAIIGHGTEIRPGAYLRGNVITGSNCVIGNSSELKNCILLNKVQVPHYNYVGDSILGNHSHMGAGSICSNLKSDGKNVVIRGKESYDTGLRKVGAFLGDGADVGCGCVLNPGVVIGKSTSVYPLTALRGIIESGCIVKDRNTIVKRV